MLHSVYQKGNFFLRNFEEERLQSHTYTPGLNVYLLCTSTVEVLDIDIRISATILFGGKAEMLFFQWKVSLASLWKILM